MAEVEIASIRFDADSNEFIASIPCRYFVTQEELDGFQSVEFDIDDNTWLVRFRTSQAFRLEEILEKCNCTSQRQFPGSYESISPLETPPNQPSREYAQHVPPSPLTPYEQALRYADEGSSFCISGSGGTGKSHLVWQIFEHLTIVKKKTVGVTALTGKAATELRAKLKADVCSRFSTEPVVTTLDEFLGFQRNHRTEIQLVRDLDSYAKILATYLKKSDSIIYNWNVTDTIIVDETSMLHPRQLTVIYLLSKYLRAKTVNNEVRPFQFIFVGDFYQIPPVVKEIEEEFASKYNNKVLYITNEEMANEDIYCFQSPFWKQIVGSRVDILNKNFRVSPERGAWIELLERVRVGKITTNDINALCQMNSTLRKITKDHLHLYACNKQVDEENQRRNEELKVNMAPGRVYKTLISKVYRKAPGSTVKENITDRYATYAVAAKLVALVVNNRTSVELFIGSKVMLDENINTLEGLVNGVHGEVCEIHDDHVVVDFDGFGRRDIAIRTHIQTSNDMESAHATKKNDVFTVEMKRLPLVLGFAVTIHKSQSMTLKYVYINLAQINPRTNQRSKSVFVPGQIYVALSRGQDPDHMIIDGFDLLEVQKFIKPIKVVDDFYAEDYTFHSAMPPQSSARTPVFGMPKNYDSTNVHHRTPGSRVPLEVMLQRQEHLRMLQAICAREIHYKKQKEVTQTYEKLVKMQQVLQGQRVNQTSNESF